SAQRPFLLSLSLSLSRWRRPAGGSWSGGPICPKLDPSDGAAGDGRRRPTPFPRHGGAAVSERAGRGSCTRSLSSMTARPRPSPLGAAASIRSTAPVLLPRADLAMGRPPTSLRRRRGRRRPLDGAATGPRTGTRDPRSNPPTSMALHSGEIPSHALPICGSHSPSKSACRFPSPDGVFRWPGGMRG
ncbi:unnamed protein product, partial [Urochloa humidicola]